MQRQRLFVAYSLLLASCVEAPKRPDLDICVTDLPDAICICQIKHTDGTLEAQRKEPLEYCDKATAFPPKEWEKVQNYIDALEAYGQAHCN